MAHATMPDQLIQKRLKDLPPNESAYIDEYTVAVDMTGHVWVHAVAQISTVRDASYNVRVRRDQNGELHLGIPDGCRFDPHPVDDYGVNLLPVASVNTLGDHIARPAETTGA